MTNEHIPADQKRHSQSAEFNRWQNLAASKGWRLPRSSPLPDEMWIDYWKACQDYERDPSKGRPVIPHRSA